MHLNTHPTISPGSTLMMFFYLLPAILVAAIALHALSQDPESSLIDVGNWLFILLAAGLWPLTLPPMLWKKYQQFKAHQSRAAAVAAPLGQSSEASALGLSLQPITHSDDTLSGRPEQGNSSA